LPVEAGATEGTFHLDHNEWTLHAADMQDVLNQNGCGVDGWEVGMTQDVSETGCIGVAKTKNACAAEYDVVALEGDHLFFGKRVRDMCTPDGLPSTLNCFPSSFSSLIIRTHPGCGSLLMIPSDIDNQLNPK